MIYGRPKKLSVTVSIHRYARSTRCFARPIPTWACTGFFLCWEQVMIWHRWALCAYSNAEVSTTFREQNKSSTNFNNINDYGKGNILAFNGFHYRNIHSDSRDVLSRFVCVLAFMRICNRMLIPNDQRSIQRMEEKQWLTSNPTWIQLGGTTLRKRVGCWASIVRPCTVQRVFVSSVASERTTIADTTLVLILSAFGGLNK